MTHRLFAVVLICAFVSSGIAQAAPPDPSVAEARLHFAEGSKAFNLGEFDRAVKEYKAAYNAKPDPVFLYNIAQSYRLAGDLSQAIFFYRSYLRNVPNSPNRKELEERIRQIEEQNAQKPAPSAPAPVVPVAPAAPIPSVAPVATPTPVAAPPVATPPVPEATPSVSSVTTDVSVSTRPASKPLYKKAWLWGVIGGIVVAAGLGVGLGIGLTHDSISVPSTPLGNQRVFLTIEGGR